MPSGSAATTRVLVLDSGRCARVAKRLAVQHLEVSTQHILGELEEDVEARRWIRPSQPAFAQAVRSGEEGRQQRIHYRAALEEARHLMRDQRSLPMTRLQCLACISAHRQEACVSGWA